MSEDIKDNRLFKSVIIVTVAMVMSRLTGFFRQMLIPNILGAQNPSVDALQAAFTITNLMYNLLLGGAIAAALVPVLSKYVAKNQEKRGWVAVSTFLNVISILTIIVCVFGMIFSPQIVPIFYNNSDPLVMELAIKLSRILFPSVLFLMLAGMVNGVLNSYKRFAAAALGPSVYNLLVALSIGLLGSRFGVEKATLGIMFSALVYFLLQLAFAMKNFRKYRPVVRLKNNGFRTLMNLAIPSIIASSVYQINSSIISTKFTSGYGTDGLLNAFRNADDIWQLPYGIFTMGIVMATLPTLSEKIALNQFDEYKSLLFGTFKSNMALILPSAIGLGFLAGEVATAIYRWSANSTAESIEWISSILIFFLIGLVSQSIIAIFNRAFYAINNTKIPLYCGVITVVVNLVLCYLFKEVLDFGIWGISFAFSLSSVVNAVVLMSILNGKVEGGMNYLKYLKFIIKLLPSLAIMTIVLLVLNKFIPFNNPESFSMGFKLSSLVALGIKTVIATVVYVVVATLTGIEEVKMVLSKIFGKFIKKSV